VNFFRKLPYPVVVGLVAVVAISFLFLATLVAETGYPGGSDPRLQSFIFAITALVLSCTGWAALWRDRLDAKGWQRIAGALAAFFFSAVGVWFLVNALGMFATQVAAE
jgi:hypothetical protein